MPINFFQAKCKSTSNKSKFGLCDDDQNQHACIDEDETHQKKWIAIIKNPSKRNVCFYAIDKCVPIKRAGGTKEKRCDGVLKINTELIFIELKSRTYNQWFPDSVKQLTATICIFKENCDMSKFSSVCAYACNNLKPKVSSVSRKSAMKVFKIDTGYALKVQAAIKI